MISVNDINFNTDLIMIKICIVLYINNVLTHVFCQEILDGHDITLCIVYELFFIFAPQKVRLKAYPTVLVFKDGLSFEYQGML